MQDREGSVWVGGLRGVARWLGYGQWEHWTTLEGLSNDIVRAVRRDASGAVWVGSDQGLYRMRPGKPGWQSWTTRQNLAGDKILALAPGSDGSIWAGISPFGVSHVDTSSGAVRRYGPESGLPADPVLTLLPDGQSRLWVATTRGLFLGRRTGMGMHFEQEVPPRSDRVLSWWAILQDREGRVWLPAGATLARWDDGKWTDFPAQQGSKNLCSSTITEGRDGAIWLGNCDPVGVTRLDLGSRGYTKVDHFDRTNGLRSNRVMSLATDPRGWIWVGTAAGLDVFDGARWRHLGEADGMIAGGANLHAFFADPDGSVEHIERALQQFDSVGGVVWHGVSRYSTRNECK